MRALHCTELSGPDSLRLVEVPAPDASGGVLIDVAAAGVSFPDLLLTQGRYQMKPELPFVPGVEVSGTVREAPAGSGFDPGDRVMALTWLGGFAEQVVAAPEQVFPIPADWSFEEAAGVVMNYHTAHFALHRRGGLRAGETVLVHGAAGGVGTASVQVARGGGARVIAVVSDERKAEVARRAGAHEVVLSTGNWVAQVKSLTQGRGADLVLDPVGGDVFDRSLKVLAPEARLLVVGFTSGRIPEVAVNRLLLKNVSVVGVAWGALAAQDPALTPHIAAELAKLAAAGVVRPLVGSVFPFERGAEALRELQERRAVGKVVLRVAG
ncbi:NADPH:quinone oxidoreductase family protein [Aggregicoccus sp. 17bor-14]|uniref:NADPH:quinone oxidoreductase family protein n=1 Tax=Myxococcaceae TaxID=31 RepID=UPI00129C6FAC|nr:MULTISPECIES: NADPH:quinone oxidoreductase family protein [Myxococcaceae]MBF5042241.1 NADPH:quinone oxidoreductase family protein [Simulacricoccus sp. 17bor-14]MRI88016.1 NADPH:quinone oxidoreductase family protein [Aggregicoccus sp. 17bor-14]